MERANGRTKKESRNEKQNEQKIETEVLKSLDEAATPELKFQLLLKKHVDSEKTQRRLEQEKKILERQLEAVVREKDNMQRELNKNMLMRDKLQEVCREQQKLMKSVKNESLQKIREEEERRKESQSKFQASLNDITQSLSKNNEENNKLRDHNMEMAKKLQYLAEQYRTRELQLEKLNEKVQIENQLNQAKLKKVQMEAAMEKEILIKEKQIALEKLATSQKLLKDLKTEEETLKAQLNLYTAKYDDFQVSLKRSNDIFGNYKVELDKMSKTIKKLEKESLQWKSKWERSNASLIELATEKQERDEHALRCNRQVEQLQKLLRVMQNERTHLYAVLRENNVECPPAPELPPEPEPMKPLEIKKAGDADRMEMMTKNCAELKETLSYLQKQMKAFTGNEGQQKAESVDAAPAAQEDPPANKKKANKRKKNKNKNDNSNEASTPAPSALPHTTGEVKDSQSTEEVPNGQAENGDKIETGIESKPENNELPIVDEAVESETETTFTDPAGPNTLIAFMQELTSGKSLRTLQTGLGQPSESDLSANAVEETPLPQSQAVESTTNPSAPGAAT